MQTRILRVCALAGAAVLAACSGGSPSEQTAVSGGGTATPAPVSAIDSALPTGSPPPDTPVTPPPAPTTPTPTATPATAPLLPPAPEPTPDPTPATRPTISGTPLAIVDVGGAYGFQAIGSNPDGGIIAFSIVNKPPWAAFDAATGLLSGTPAAADAGTYSNIVISVSDGTLDAVLPAFSITVNQVSAGTATLHWTPPTENTDGSPLSDLAGYRVLYGTNSTNLDRTVQLTNPGLSSYVVEDLAPGTWYFVVKAYNGGGAASAGSNIANKTIQ